MKEADAEIVLQRAHEAYPGSVPASPQTMDPQFVAKDIKAFIRHFQTPIVFCSPHYPQSNGKIERLSTHSQRQAIRPKTL
jgi:hypothetical protein